MEPQVPSEGVPGQGRLRRWFSKMLKENATDVATEAASDGCFDGCSWDGCDGCDGCSGCDLFWLGLLAGPFLRRSSAPAAEAAVVPAVMRPVPGASRAVRLLLALLRVYKRLLAPRLPVRCRYSPSCSAYAAEAVQRHGVRRGGRLARARVRRCRPPFPRGEDLVPLVLPSGALPVSGRAPRAARAGSRWPSRP